MKNLIESLWQANRHPNPEGQPVVDSPGLSIDEGQWLQLKILDRWLDLGESLAGYKIGLTSGRMRDAFGKGIRPFGYILGSRILSSGQCVVLDEIGRLGIENELVFRVGENVRTADATKDLASRIIDGVAPAFEINQIRLAGTVSSGVRVADNLTQWGIVTGQFITPQQDYDNLLVTLSHNGNLKQSVPAAGHIDNHFTSIATLINRLNQFDRGLKKGDLIITGSYTKQSIDSAGIWLGEFGPIGQVELAVKTGGY